MIVGGSAVAAGAPHPARRNSTNVIRILLWRDLSQLIFFALLIAAIRLAALALSRTVHEARRLRALLSPTATRRTSPCPPGYSMLIFSNTSAVSSACSVQFSSVCWVFLPPGILQVSDPSCCSQVNRHALPDEKRFALLMVTAGEQALSIQMEPLAPLLEPVQRAAAIDYITKKPANASRINCPLDTSSDTFSSHIHPCDQRLSVYN